MSSTPLLWRLEAIGARTQAERDLLANLPGTTRHLGTSLMLTIFGLQRVRTPIRLGAID
jgi:hypothetical protein